MDKSAELQRAFKAISGMYDGFVYDHNHLYIEYIDDTGTVNEDDMVDSIDSLLCAIGLDNVSYIFDFDNGRYMIYDSSKEKYEYDNHDNIIRKEL